LYGQKLYRAQLKCVETLQRHVLRAIFIKADIAQCQSNTLIIAKTTL